MIRGLSESNADIKEQKDWQHRCSERHKSDTLMINPCEEIVQGENSHKNLQKDHKWTEDDKSGEYARRGSTKTAWKRTVRRCGLTWAWQYDAR